MPRVRVQLADGSWKHVNMSREELVRYNTTRKLSGDVINQDNLLLKVLNQNGVLNDAKVTTIKDVNGDLKDFVANQDNIVSFLSSYKTVQEETNGIREGGDQILMEVADNAPQNIKNQYYWTHTIKFDNKITGSTTVDLLDGVLPPGFNIRDTNNNVMSNNTLSTTSKSVQLYGTTDMTAVSDYIDSGSIHKKHGFIPHHPSELDAKDEERYIELLDVKYTNSIGSWVENPTKTFQVGDVIHSLNHQDNYGRVDGMPRKGRPIVAIQTYTENNTTKTKILVREMVEYDVLDESGAPVIIEGTPITVKDVITFTNRKMQLDYIRSSDHANIKIQRKRVPKSHRFRIEGQGPQNERIFADYYDSRYKGEVVRPLAKNYYFQLGIKYSGQSDYSDKKWFAIVCVNNYDGTRDIIVKTLKDTYLSRQDWAELIDGASNDPQQEFDLDLYFSGDSPTLDYFWDGSVKDIVGDYVLPFTDTSGDTHQISVTNEIIPFKFYSSTQYLVDDDIPLSLSLLKAVKGALEWEINLSGTKYYKTQQLESS